MTKTEIILRMINYVELKLLFGDKIIVEIILKPVEQK